jgi:hypothetical protein
MTPIAIITRPLYILALFIFCSTLLLVGCGQQQQSQQSDPRLKVFHVLSAHIVILDSQAEVDGKVQNTGTMRFPFDVSMIATFYDSASNVVGQARGTAEDVYPGMTRSFVLVGQVDSAKYSRMAISPVSLRERRQEKNLPTPPPVVP